MVNRLLGCLALAGCAFGQHRDWRAYGGGPEGIRYSALRQIDRTNVGKLRVAWTFDTGDASDGSEMQCNPIVVDGVLYATTPRLRVVALDAATGHLRWSYDPNDGAPYKGRNRGVAYWSDKQDARVFFVWKSFLIGLDAKTGKPVLRVDLREGLGRDPQSLTVTATTPGVVYGDLLIQGSLVSEGLPSAPGDIRAYEVRTGKIRWSFHTLPHPGEFGYGTWPKDAWTYSGGTNSWAGMALDEKRGLVFVPTGSASFDFYGANRVGDNLFANSLIALRAGTGERVWHFQAVKHDVWDRDFPAPPSLVRIKRDGRVVDAVAQITKSGHVYVFDRESGKPLFPIEERAVPASDVKGEVLAKTQPLPLKPEPFARQQLTEDLLTRRTPEAHRAVLERFRQVRSGGPFMPPSTQGTIVFPGFDGGGEWGGGTFDPETGLFYVNANEMAWILRLVPREEEAKTTSGGLYRAQCAGCHRDDRRGTPPNFPSLEGIAGKRKDPAIAAMIRHGAGRMPGFAHLGESRIGALVRFLKTGDDRPLAGKLEDIPAAMRLEYSMDGYNKFLDPEGYPAVAPPWGTLTAIDLNTGDFRWRIPFGEHPALAAKGMNDTGSENYGGSVATAGGLLFIGATNFDRKFRAFDKLTGKLLWETMLPAAGNATPATYTVRGRQYVVIAAGGGKSGNPSGGQYVAFALP